MANTSDYPYDLRVEADSVTGCRVLVIAVHASVPAKCLSPEVIEHDTFVLQLLPEETTILTVSLPFPVQDEAASAKYTKRAGGGGTLTFKAPELPCSSAEKPQQPDNGSTGAGISTKAATHPHAVPGHVMVPAPPAVDTSDNKRTTASVSNGGGAGEDEQDDLELLREMYGDEVVDAPTTLRAPQAAASTRDQQPVHRTLHPDTNGNSTAQPYALHPATNGNSTAQPQPTLSSSHAAPSQAACPTTSLQYSQGCEPGTGADLGPLAQASHTTAAGTSQGPGQQQDPCHNPPSTAPQGHVQPHSNGTHSGGKAQPKDSQQPGDQQCSGMTAITGPASLPATSTTSPSTTQPTPQAVPSIPQQQQQQEQQGGGVVHQRVGGEVQEASALDCTNLSVLLSSGSHKASLHVQGSAKKTAKAEKKTVSSMLNAIANHLETYGWVVCDGYVPMDMVIDVRKEIKVMEDHYTSGEIWVGKEADVGATITRSDVRGDKVLWLDAQALAATAFVKDGVQRKCTFRTLTTVMKSIDRLITGELPALSPQLRHVRDRSDTMCAIYPGNGARFAKHIDNTANDGRRLTLLCYLNPNWRDSQGGALRLFPPGCDPVDVYPRAGRMAMFLSKTVAHEVMPTAVPRHSFTLWYYDALERAESVATARVAAGGSASPEAQLAARDLLRDILAGDSGALGALQADEEGLEALQARVKLMPKAAKSIVASITGLASAEAFEQSVEVMSTGDLVQLREALSVMGLGQEHTPTPV